MEPNELAESVAITLGFSLSYLLGEKTEDEAVRELGTVGWQEAKAVWATLQRRLEADPTLLEVARGIVSAPGPEAMAALRRKLEEELRSDPMLMGEIRDAIRGGSHASLFGMPSSTLPGAASPKAKLLASQPTYIVLLLVIVWLAWMINHRETLQESINSIALLLRLATIVVKASFLILFARKYGMEKPLILGLSAFAPGGFIIAGLSLAAYRPPHMTQAALAGETVPRHGELRSWIRGLIVLAAFPPVFLVVLALYRYEYYLQFFENVPGILLLVVTLLAYGVGTAALWIGFRMRKAYTSLRLALASVISGWCISFVVWSVLLGPAVAKVFTLFSE